jgi:hypothetical protein
MTNPHPQPVATTELPFEAVLAEELRELEGGPAPGSPAPSREDLYRRIHEHGLSALCLSGGGIRSATFALGVVQGLARRGLLTGFHYLSTVSGGGYLGGWLTAWIHRHPKGQDGVCCELSRGEAPTGACRSLSSREPETIRHLRSYSNYLSPRLGLLSADSWTLAAIYLRNLLLVWSVLVPLMLAVVGVPWLILASFEAGHGRVNLSWLPTAFAVLGFLLAVAAVTYFSVEQPGAGLQPEDDRGCDSPQKCSRDQGTFLRWCLTPLLGSAFCLTSYWGWIVVCREAPGALQFLLFVAGAHTVGWLLSLSKRRLLPAWYDGLVVIASGVAAGAGTWIVARNVPLGSISDPRLYVSFAFPLFLAVFLLAGIAYVGLATSHMHDDEREWAARLGAWVLLAAVAWAVATPLVLLGPAWLEGVAGLGFGSVGGLSGLLTVLLGGSSATPAKADGDGHDRQAPQWLAGLARKTPKLAAPVFLVCLVPFLSWLLDRRLRPGFAAGIDWLLATSGRVPAAGVAVAFYDTPAGRCLLLAGLLGGLLLLALGASRCIDVNKYSLHAMYRARLIRAYLGASRSRTNRFTGFDPADNIGMDKLRGKNCFGQERTALLPVVNCALNLVGGDELAWQERKAESFTITPLHSGSERVGYRRSAEYAKRDKRAISLGTAMAISGAAASPNMGYHSSSLVTLLMTLFNVRLGWWLGNPGGAGEETYRFSNPRSTLKPLLDEALGLTSDQNPYVYLSDGGHFENLGLYEMVRRRCHLLVVSDAGCDPDLSLEDLGNAVRKIRIDLGVPIEFPSAAFGSTAGRRGASRFAAGVVRYSRVDGQDAPDGLLLYLKPVLLGDEPSDVGSYARSARSFPHETTADQWFSESQFESYRALGLHTIESVLEELGAAGRTSLEEVERRLSARVHPAASSAAA